MNHPDLNKPIAIRETLSLADSQKPEDAFMTAIGERAGLIACFDGCGATGVKHHSSTDRMSGAYMASHICSTLTNQWFNRHAYGELGLRDNSGLAIGEGLHRYLTDSLTRIYAIMNDAGSIRGRLAKPLPTTLAAALLEPQPERTRCLFMWAGDSRAFLFTTQGLRQMTADDRRDTEDPSLAPELDGALSNVVSATGNFVIHARNVYVTSPCLAIVATHGCFADFASPIEFEGLLLQSLMAAHSMAEWQEEMTARIKQSTSRDFTLTAAVMGFSSFDEIRSAYQQRAAIFAQRYLEPLEVCKQANNRRGMLRLWDQYKIAYLPVISVRDRRRKMVI
jgi:serine/threonine protein phosphatase PrpC